VATLKPHQAQWDKTNHDLRLLCHPPQRAHSAPKKNLVPGTIVILHDGISNPNQTIRALPQILAAAHRKGLRIVSIGALKAAAVQPDANLMSMAEQP